MSAYMLKVSLLGVGTVLRLARDAWSMVIRLRQATIEYAPSPSLKHGVREVARQWAIKPLMPTKRLAPPK